MLAQIGVLLSVLAVAAAAVIVLMAWRVPLGDSIDVAINWLREIFAKETRAIADYVKDAIDWLVEDVLLWTRHLGIEGTAADWLMIGLVAALAWWVSRHWGITLFCLLGLGLMWNMGLWIETMQTLAVVIVSTLVCIVVGVPVGILAALSTAVERIVKPILDFMQTLPAFVYLLPAIPFFGTGYASALVTTVIFSIPPTIRLTTLGIQQVPEDLVEASNAFGSTTMQKMIKLQLPLAMPTLRAGVNQTIMLGLSMAVIAALIGAPGLGKPVWLAINSGQMAVGFEAGIAIVILAIVLDRIMQNVGRRTQQFAGE